MLKDFLTGAGYVFRGCRQFYGDRTAWKYCILPVGLLLVFYIFLYAGVFCITGILVDRVIASCERLPEYLASKNHLIFIPQNQKFFNHFFHFFAFKPK